VNYKVYNIQDLLADKSFNNWVNQSNQLDIEYWNAYLMANPNQTELLETASSIIKGIPVVEKKLSLAEVDHNWELLEENLKARKLVIEKRSKGNIYWTAAAAVFVGFMAMAVYFLVSNRVKTIEYSTAPGEKKEIILPDRSVVILNSNSHMIYQEPSEGNAIRTVILEGQAFFSVYHTIDNKKFVVRTPDDLQVEVLGTKFNISSRCKGTSVVLNSGKIRLNIENENLLMAPGEMVLLNEGKKTLIKKKVNPEIYSAWKDNKLIFEDNSLEEIITVLQANYGIEIQLTNKELLQKRFTGTFQADKLDVLFVALSNSFNLQYTRNEDKVLLKPYKQNF
jgi:ferric-dicitrate binding protein FerR (iron transport regulator)